eukprot:XP_011662013.1 PREDICTED: uncharacterized protein LOC100890400 [Strongylocentrotus purpuratus]
MLGAVNLLASLNKCRPAVTRSLCLPGLHFQARSSNLFCVNRRTMSDSKAEIPVGSEPSPWQQGFYKYFLPIQTRFLDTDCFGHVNNAVYYSFFDTVINHYLYKHCSFRHPKKNTDEPNIVGFMVDTRGTFRKPLNFPEVILAGMAVTKLGNSSVTYTVGIFAEKEARSKLTESLSVDGVLLEKNEAGCFDGYDEMACSVGQCVHVFVDVNGDQKPLRIPDVSRLPLSNILVPFEGQISKL